MTIRKLTMPQLGESVTEGTISKWLVSVGDRVHKYDPIAEVVTDKVNAEVPSSFTGVIKSLLVQEGKTLPVGEVICLVEVEGDQAEENHSKVTKDSAAGHKNSAFLSQKRRYSPAVLRLAQEHSINLENIEGTGAEGRITRKDLLRYIEAECSSTGKGGGSFTKPLELPEKHIDHTPLRDQTISPTISSKNDDIELPISQIRRTIAANMLRSKQEIPHAWMMIEIDATNLVQYRNAIKDEVKQREGFNLTYFAFFVKAAAQALKEFPQVNSMWAGETIVQKNEVNISIAVAKEDLLYVPVIKRADEKTIKGIAREISELAEKVRRGSLRPEDMQNGTFTVNNTGSFGSVQSMGIINYPQAAILQVESIIKRPVVMNNGMIAVRDMVNVCMSLDHRILDGLICGRFLARVKQIIENISIKHTSIY